MPRGFKSHPLRLEQKGTLIERPLCARLLRSLSKSTYYAVRVASLTALPRSAGRVEMAVLARALFACGRARGLGAGEVAAIRP